MNIKKDTWHYEVWEWSCKIKPRYGKVTLCNYFWRVVFAMFLFAPGVAVGRSIRRIALTMIGTTRVQNERFGDYEVKPIGSDNLSIILILMWIVVLNIIPIIYFYTELGSTLGIVLWILEIIFVAFVLFWWTKERLSSLTSDWSFLGVFKDYVSAKKRKVCPIVEFE